MALSQELDALIKSMDLEQGNGGFAGVKPGADLLKAEADAGVVGNNAASMSKAEDAQDEDGDDKDEDDQDMDKSLSGRLRTDDDMAKSIDAAPILDELIVGIDELADRLSKSLDDQSTQQNVVNEALIKGLSKALQMLQAQGEVNKSLSDTLAVLSGRPATARKAAQPGTQVLEKGMGGVTQESGMPREVIQQKLVKGIGMGIVGAEQASIFDRTGAIAPQTFELIKSL